VNDTEEEVRALTHSRLFDDKLSHGHLPVLLYFQSDI